jgi:hypothetical protein
MMPAFGEKHFAQLRSQADRRSCMRQVEQVVVCMAVGKLERVALCKGYSHFVLVVAGYTEGWAGSTQEQMQVAVQVLSGVGLLRIVVGGLGCRALTLRVAFHHSMAVGESRLVVGLES